MEGKFRTRVAQVLFSALMMLGGTAILVRFALWGIDAARIGESSEAGFCFGFALIGLVFGVLSIVVFNYNKNAKFVVGTDSVEIFYAHVREITIPLCEIEWVEASANSVTLFTADGETTVDNLENPFQLCDYLLARLGKKRKFADALIERAKYRAIRRKLIPQLVGCALLTLMMFGYIFICVALTDGKDIAEFTEEEDRIFLAFIITEAINAAALLLLAVMAGKNNLAARRAKRNILFALAYTHRHDGENRVPDLREVKFFDNYTYRILIWIPYEGACAYMLERFDFRTESWVNCYEKGVGFGDLSELYEDLAERFEDVRFDEDEEE